MPATAGPMNASCCGPARKLTASESGCSELARTLQQSLLPPSLPVVPGLDAAAHYHLASADEVGGDFYDLFPLSQHRWGVSLGDVCGKGAHAATITSMIRYTLRTAAVYDADPAAVLGTLNPALHDRYLGRPPVLLHRDLRPAHPRRRWLHGGPRQRRSSRPAAHARQTAPPHYVTAARRPADRHVGRRRIRHRPRSASARVTPFSCSPTASPKPGPAWQTVPAATATRP